MLAIWNAVFGGSRVKRVIVFIVIVFGVAIVYSFVNYHNFSWYNMSHVVGVRLCLADARSMNDLKSLAFDCHEIMQNFSLTHFLVYGSLFGALRHNDPLPWDNDVDMGLLQSEVRTLDESKFYAAFKARNIVIYYRPWFGTYRVIRGLARGDLMVFRKAYASDFMCRTGIEPWVFFVNHYRYHMFPTRLIEKPLATTQFAGANMPVPNEGMEMQKYLYPDDWDMEVKPKGCS